MRYASIQLGLSPLTWTNDDMPELGGETSLESCLSEIAQCGFTGTELGIKYPRTSVELAPILEKHALKLASGWFSGQLILRSLAAEKKSIQDHLDLLLKMGAKVMVYGEIGYAIQGKFETPLKNKHMLSVDEMQRYAEKLSQLATWLLEQGMQMAYHYHMGAICETFDDIKALVHASDESVGFTFDTGHAFLAGMDPLALGKFLGQRIKHVHLKDVRPSIMQSAIQKHLSFMQAVLAGVFTVPGDGGIDFAPIYQYLLAELSYQGWMVVEAEQDPAKAVPLEYAMKASRHCQNFLAAYC